jgi:hypothetical protein
MRSLGAIAQLGERLAGSQKVEGSSPSSSTTPGGDRITRLPERVSHCVEIVESRAGK